MLNSVAGQAQDKKVFAFAPLFVSQLIDFLVDT